MGEVFVINTLFNSHWELGGRNTTSLLAASLMKSCFSHSETRIVCVYVHGRRGAWGMLGVEGTGNSVFACFWLCALLLLCNGDSEGSSDLTDDLKACTPWRNSEKVKCKYVFHWLLFPILFIIHSNIIHVTIVLVKISMLLIGMCVFVMVPWGKDMPVAS